MPYLTAPQAKKTERTYRYFVELASDELELDAYGDPVPVDYTTVDVVVLEPTVKAINSLIAAADWLAGYTLVNYWVPEDGCDAF